MDTNSCVLFEMLVDRLRSAMNHTSGLSPPPATPFAREGTASTSTERLSGEIIRVHWPFRHKDTPFYPAGGYSDTTYLQVQHTSVVTSYHHTLSMHLLTTSCQHILSSHPDNTQASIASSSSAGSRSQTHPPSLSSLPPPPPPHMVPTAPTAVLSSPRSLMEGVPSVPCPYVTDVYPISGATPSSTCTTTITTTTTTTTTTPYPSPYQRSRSKPFFFLLPSPNVAEITRRLLLHSRLDVERLAALLAYDCSYATWTNMMTNEVIRFEALGWRLSEPLSLIRAGERELGVVCRGLDRNSAAVAEVMLLRVGDLETRCGIAPLDDNHDHDPASHRGNGRGSSGSGSGTNPPAFSFMRGRGGGGGGGGNTTNSPGGVPNNSASPHH